MTKQMKPARGLNARGARGARRERLAKAAGFRSDAHMAELFPANRQKQVRQLQQALAALVSSLNPADSTLSAVAVHYGALIKALSASGTQPSSSPPEADESFSTSAKAAKQMALATEALRQMVLEAVEAPLALLPSLLADDSLSDQQKLQRLGVYTSALESVYEPLQLMPLGEPGEATVFDPRHHDSATVLSKGDACTIRQIGFCRGDTVVRKAVVVAAE